MLLNETLSQLFESAVVKTVDHISPEEWEALMEYHVRIYQCLADQRDADGVAAINAHYDWIEEE